VTAGRVRHRRRAEAARAPLRAAAADAAVEPDPAALAPRDRAGPEVHRDARPAAAAKPQRALVAAAVDAQRAVLEHAVTEPERRR
jgi:hypothetical protein